MRKKQNSRPATIGSWIMFCLIYLLDFVLLAGTEIRSKKKTLEKLAEMEIIYKE